MKWPPKIFLTENNQILCAETDIQTNKQNKICKLENKQMNAMLTTFIIEINTNDKLDILFSFFLFDFVFPCARKSTSLYRIFLETNKADERSDKGAQIWNTISNAHTLITLGQRTILVYAGSSQISRLKLYYPSLKWITN